MVSTVNDILETLTRRNIRQMPHMVQSATAASQAEVDALRAFGEMWTRACAQLPGNFIPDFKLMNDIHIEEE